MVDAEPFGAVLLDLYSSCQVMPVQQFLPVCLGEGQRPAAL